MARGRRGRRSSPQVNVPPALGLSAGEAVVVVVLLPQAASASARATSTSATASTAHFLSILVNVASFLASK